MKRLKFFGIPKVWPLIRKYKSLMIAMIVQGLVVSVIDAVYPLFNKYAIDHFIHGRTLDTLPYFVGLYIVIVAIQAVVNYINVNYCSKVEMYTNRDLRNAAFSHMQTLSLSYYNQNSVGYIHARVISDAGKIGEMVSWQLMHLIWFGSYIIFVLGFMFVTNVRLALCVTVLVPVAVFLIHFFQKRLIYLNRKVREMNSKITADINEGITGVKSMKALVVENKLYGEFQRDTKSMYKKSVRATRYSALFSATVTMLSAVALAVVLWRGGELTNERLIRIGTLSVFMSYTLSLLDPIQNVIRTTARMIEIGVNIERYTTLLATQGEVFDTKEVIEKYGDQFHTKKENWEKLHGDIEFRDVTFHYPDGEELVLEHFNLKLKKGTNVAIVGETGAGKSTLVNLVCRFFEPTEGEVLLDGKDVRERSLQWLHSQLGYVLQTPHLFSGSVRENLRYGNPEATDEEIYEALRLVSADFVIEKLPDGLDTQIGEGGDFLSMGEKQLLSIARAMLANPKILILDEATSSIDTVMEKKIQDAIQTVVKGRTSFVIAHRLSTVVDADVILVVSDGTIVERGTHHELMKKKGEYYQLYTRQYEELLIDEMI